MDLNRLTQKSQGALHDAQTKAKRFGHTEVDGERLLLAVVDDPDGLVPRLTDLPQEVRALMGLYPQPGGRQPSVEYVPAPAPSPDGQSQRRWAPSPRHPARPAGS